VGRRAAICPPRRSRARSRSSARVCSVSSEFFAVVGSREASSLKQDEDDVERKDRNDRKEGTSPDFFAAFAPFAFVVVAEP